MSIYYDLGLVVGPQGPQGPQGPAGPGGGLPSGGTAGQVLTKTAEGAAWADPAGGSGKQDKITASGVLQGDGNGGVTAKAVDTVPASGSANLISSGAVYTAIIGAIGGSY